MLVFLRKNWPFFTHISGRNFLPELCGEVHPETAPLQALCCALRSTEQSTFRGREQDEKVPRKGEKGGWPAKGATRKKGRVKTGQKTQLNSQKKWVKFMNCSPQNPPHPTPPKKKSCPCRSLHCTMHSYTFLYTERRGILKGLGTCLLGRLLTFLPFFALFGRVRRAPGKSRKRRKKGLFTTQSPWPWRQFLGTDKKSSLVGEGQVANIFRGRQSCGKLQIFLEDDKRATSCQQLTCKMVWHLLFSFSFSFLRKGLILRESKAWKSVKKCGKVWKSVEKCEKCQNDFAL